MNVFLNMETLNTALGADSCWREIMMGIYFSPKVFGLCMIRFKLDYTYNTNYVVTYFLIRKNIYLFDVNHHHHNNEIMSKF